MKLKKLLEAIVYKSPTAKKNTPTYVLKNPSYKEIQDLLNLGEEFNEDNYLRFIYNPKTDDIFFGHSMFYEHKRIADKTNNIIRNFVTGMVYKNKDFRINHHFPGEDKQAEKKLKKINPSYKKNQNYDYMGYPKKESKISKFRNMGKGG